MKNVMNWSYIKSHWFTIAMGCVVLLAVFRNGIPDYLGGGHGNRKKKTEKLTEAQASTQEGKSLFGLTPAPVTPADKNKGISSETAESFLKRFGQVAIGEKKKFGVPASVLLACAYVNSEAGQRETVRVANNYFALPCSDAWEGEEANVGSHCFREYPNAWESFRDFSIHLAGCDWYGKLRKNAGKDWKAWVKGIRAGDVSDVPDFQEKLTEVIEAYRLFELDGK